MNMKIMIGGNKIRTMIREDTEMKKLSALLSEVQERNTYQCLGYETLADSK